MVYCCVFGCSSRSPCEFSFHFFPKNVSFREAWRTKLKRRASDGSLWTPDYSIHRVCSRHFSPDDFVKNPELMKAMGLPMPARPELKPGVVPSLHLGYGETEPVAKPAFAKRQRKRVSFNV